jgi:hypothetical protein
LWRWTIGGKNLHKRAFDLLFLSIKRTLRLYKEEFDFVICYNTLNQNQINLVNNFGIQTHKQVPFLGGLSKGGRNTLWKYAPPRLRLQSHELFVDNDIIIEKRLPQIDSFLQQNKFMLTEGLRRCYGVFNDYVPKNLSLNGGLVGVPPNIDLQSMLVRKLKKLGKADGQILPKDEQGLIAHIVSSSEFIKIPVEVIYTLYCDEIKSKGTHGTHFIGANYHHYHHGWKQYQKHNTVTHL